MRIRYHSWTHRPPHRVSCRLLAESGSAPAVQRFEGIYRDSTWVFDIPDAGQWNSYVLVLDGQKIFAEMPRPVVDITDLDEAEFDLPAIPIWVDEGRLQQTWFAQGRDDEDRWDVVVVGTGMGGGVCASALATKLNYEGAVSRKVLSLEAGSLLFPTHIGNLPRVIYGADPHGATSLWNTLERFGCRPFDLAAGITWQGSEVFALGGRSLYWGGLCPRLSPHELALWPDAVTEQLLDDRLTGPGYYTKAEALLDVGHPRVNDLERRALGLLDNLFPARVNQLAPVAAQRERATGWRLPGGLFSTAELLLAQRLEQAKTRDDFGPPYIHLAVLVTGLERDHDDWLVHGVDLRDGSAVRHRARRVVLCAGTVETARIVASSDLPGMPPGAGQNFTEHPMAYMHFEVPSTSAFYQGRSSANLLSVAGETDPDDWNMQFELGSDTILDHMLPGGWSATESLVDDGYIAGQVVFLGRADLGPGEVQIDRRNPWLDLAANGRYDLPSLTLNPATATPPIDQWEAAADRIADAIGARKLPRGPELRVVQAVFGSVAHEVGTMRLGAAQPRVVDENLEVDGCPGLFVCDNSVFPTSPAANPSLTLAALALRLADYLWDDL